jgi:hypothetical protein
MLTAVGAPHKLLCARLLWMAFWDQRARFALMERMRAVDERNTRRMRALIERYGWPGTDVVGQPGAEAAWLLIQHADQDPPFQEHCLELLRAAVQRGVASRQNLAYLEDRVRIHHRRPQLYGTQLTERAGRVEPLEIEDAEHVDERRAAAGLEPLADYLRLAEQNRPR